MKADFKQYGGSGFDANGNLTQDLNKNISLILYNMLNLPELIYVNGGGASNTSMMRRVAS